MKFYTLFPDCQNIHLIKDVGMIPYILNKEHGVDAYIVSNANGDYPYLKTEVVGLNHVVLKRVTGNKNLDSLIFVFFNFWKIDALQLYHFNIFNVIILNLFKFLNFFRKSKTYLKLDADDGILDLKLRGVHGNFFKYLISKIDIISIETQLLYKELIKRPYFNNLIYLPNGFTGEKVEIANKESFFLTVGRIGTHQKNTELLLEAFRRKYTELNGWKLIIIGPIEEKEKDFNGYISHFFANNPQLKDDVLFLGPIYDRKLLNDYYKRADVFVMPSRYEGFALVYLEAIKFGCKMLLSNIRPAFDIVKSDKIGYLFSSDEVEDLGLKLIKISSEPIDVKNNLYIQDFACQNFHWSKIVDELYNKLKI
ncbi:glycosyltransferase family 4 protein [Pedobacter agri]|uniref:glycosyltransferase family 4 protein n=1 Tax=Pedobacter agri TaxID=454586 RepID=UPI0027827248|nr:glycosyltransferase [Pedobacter agri]MDQ1141124.1 glycosyltransferase involved in cell wall biosynthesis [Pedobacter agri]